MNTHTITSLPEIETFEKYTIIEESSGSSPDINDMGVPIVCIRGVPVFELKPHQWSKKDTVYIVPGTRQFGSGVHLTYAYGLREAIDNLDEDDFVAAVVRANGRYT